MSKIVKYPFGKADEQSIAYAASMTATVQNSETTITIGQMTGAGELDLDVDAEVATGANLTIKVSADATGRALTFGDGFFAPVFTVVASKTFALNFKYVGGKFTLLSSLRLN